MALSPRMLDDAAVLDLHLDAAVEAAEDAGGLLPLGGDGLLGDDGHGRGPYTMMIVIARPGQPPASSGTSRATAVGEKFCG